MEGNRKKLKLHRFLQLYLSKKLKKIPPIHVPTTNHPASIAGGSCLHSACRYPRTPSLTGDGDDNSRDQAATLSDIDRFLFENFRSLYICDDDDDKACLSSSPETCPSVETSLSSSFSQPSAMPGVKEASSDTDGASHGVAVMTFSMDPYRDFRRSMQSMMEKHHGKRPQPLDWDFMEELLFYYTQLNDRRLHKYILKAFADLAAEIQHTGPARRNAQWAGKSVRSREYE